jgi:CheY-like chemotaxis protein
MASIQPDVLIADLNMPGVDGFELLKTLKQSAQFQRMTCLVISALSPDEIAAKGGLPEGTIFMAKPVNMQWFNGFFTALIAGRKMEHGVATA